LAGITSKITSIDTADTARKAEPLDLAKPLPIKEKPLPIASPAPDVYAAPSRPAYLEDAATNSFGWIRLVTISAVLLWLAAAAIICFSMLGITANAKSYSALQWTGLAALIFGPLLMIGVAAFSLKQLAQISVASDRLATLAQALTTPDELVVGKSQSMAAAINQQVDSVNEKLSAALGRLTALETTLKAQSEALSLTNRDAMLTADHIATAITQQTTALDGISDTFDGRMGALSGIITGHSDKLADAARMAEQKIKEARISVEGATAKINSASDTVRSHTVQAASTLNASHQDIQSLGDIVKQRSDELDQVYKKHAGDLTTMIEHLRDEQQNLGAVLEERLTKMRDISLSAQASAESLVQASKAGKETVEALAESASLADSAVKSRFTDMQDMVKYSSDHAQSISDQAAQRVQDSLELTRREIGRIEDDMAELQGRLSHSASTINLTPSQVTHKSSKVKQKTENSADKKGWARLKFLPVDDDIFKADDVSGTTTTKQTDTVPPKAAPLQEPVEAPALDLDITELTPDDLGQATEDAFAPEAIRRAVPLDTDDTAKAKSGFSLRGLFSGRDKEHEGSSLDIAIPKQDTNTEERRTADADILADLEKLGLAPNVVVDNGCVIEATNTRTAKGHEAMSKIVGERLGSPVEHLSKALAIDSNLSAKVIKFATNIDHSIELLAGDREAIRTRLESEDGRAYLLVDAALNYGRV